MNALSLTYSPSSLSAFGGEAWPMRGGGGGSERDGGVVSGVSLVEAGVDVAGLSETFAQDVARRLEQSGVVGKDGLDPARGRDSGSLVEALSVAMDFIREEYGDAAATQAMGRVYAGLGGEGIDEDDLGRGLLSVVAMVDRSFGFDQGDRVMAHFNGGLNKAVNDFFDNGENETFWASAPMPAGGVSLSGSGILERIRQEIPGQDADAMAMLLEPLLEESDPAALRRTLPGVLEDVRALAGDEAGRRVSLIFGEGLDRSLAAPASLYGPDSALGAGAGSGPGRPGFFLDIVA